MKIRFGYVAMALNLENGSPNKTVTYTSLMKLNDPKDRLSKLRRIARSNLECLLRVLRYNKFHHIEVFRLTSKLIPLATHPVTEGWRYEDEFRQELAEIGAFIREHGMRVSFHPDHFTLLNSTNEAVVQASLKILEYHAKLLRAMDLGYEAKLVLHLGASYNDKERAIRSFEQRFSDLPEGIKRRIILENDDKIYTIRDVLNVCERLAIPLVADLHHHSCLNGGENITDLWPEIVSTWYGETPKIHFSSPKDARQFRAHADFIDVRTFYEFIGLVKRFGQDFDVMIEAKQKDKALFRLLDDLKTQVGVMVPPNEATVIWKN